MVKRKAIKVLARKANAGTRLIVAGERLPIGTIGVGTAIFAKPIYKPIGLAIMLSSPAIKNRLIDKGIQKHEEMLKGVLGRPRLASAVSKKTNNPNLRVMVEIFGNAKTKNEKELFKKIAECEASEKEIDLFSKKFVKQLRQSKDPQIRKLFYFKRGARGVPKQLIDRTVREIIIKEIGARKLNFSDEEIMKRVGASLNKASVKLSAQNTLDIFAISDRGKRKRIMQNLLRVYERQAMLETWGKSKNSTNDVIVMDSAEAVINEFPTVRAGKNFIGSYNEALTNLLEVMPAATFAFLQSIKT